MCSSANVRCAAGRSAAKPEQVAGDRDSIEKARRCRRSAWHMRAVRCVRADTVAGKAGCGVRVAKI